MTLEKDDIHVWLAWVDGLRSQQDDLARLLTPDEMARADRLLGEKVRQQFIVARGVMRKVLAHYIDGEIHLLRGNRGKPHIPGVSLRFNLSHAADLIVLGIAEGREIGVDVELIRPMREMMTVARSYFSVEEQVQIFNLPQAQRERAFYTCWTRKEAYIKARGDGFTMPLTGFDVTLIPGEPPRLLRAVDDDPARWTLLHLDSVPGYVGTICVEGPVQRVIHHDYPSA